MNNEVDAPQKEILQSLMILLSPQSVQSLSRVRFFATP